MVGALKPSITFCSLGSLRLAPAHSQLAPQFTPACSSSLPAHSSVCSSLLPPCPIAPYTPQVVGTPTHTWPLGASWSELGAGSKLEQAGSKVEQAGSWSELGASWSELEASWSELGARGASFSLLPCCPLAPLPPEVVETPIHSKLFIAH